MSFSERLDKADEVARFVLRSNGFPEDVGPYPEGVEPDFEVGYAARTRVVVRSLKNAIACGETEYAAERGLDLGVLLQEQVMKGNFESAAIVGANFRDNRDAANKERARDREPEIQKWKEAAAKFKARNPTAIDSQIIRHVHKMLGLKVSEKTLRRHLFPK